MRILKIGQRSLRNEKLSKMELLMGITSGYFDRMYWNSHAADTFGLSV